jgi:hypothetical protein
VRRGVKNSNNEPMKLTKSRNRKPEAGAVARQAGGGGQKAGSFRTGTMGKRVEVGKGGQEIGKWRSFSHFETALTRLFPDNSTQVVDCPHPAMGRLFSEGARIGFSGPNREVLI